VPWLSIRDAKAHHAKRIRDTEECTNELGIANSSARVLPKGTVCLSRTASVGYVVIMDRPMATSQDFVNWICGDELLPEFLQHLLLAEGEDILRFASGAVHQTIYFPEAKAFWVCVPDGVEQRRIVTLLDEAFEGIATAKAHAEQSLRNATEVYQAALANGISIGDEGETKAIGDWVACGVLAKPQDGNHGEIHPTKADYVDVGVPFVMAADLVDGVVDQANCRFLSKEHADGLRIGFAKSGDVLLSHKGTIGRVALLATELDYVMLTPQVTYYRPLDTTRLSSEFLYFALQAPGFQAAMTSIADAGSTRAYIGITKQLELRLTLPPLPRQIEIAKVLRELEGRSTCPVSCDHIPRRSWALFRARDVMRGVIESLKQSIPHE